MAFEAAIRKRGCTSLSLMHVVTRGTTHIRRSLITPAHLQKGYLIAVYIYPRRVGLILTEIFAERLSGNIGKSSCEGDPATSMTLCTDLNLAFPRQLCRIDDASSCLA